MNDFLSDELLSAYLDGELSSEEQVRIEEALSGDPRWRQLLDEMRGLREAFEVLPAYRLETDFAQKVLRRAEREMLASHSNGNNYLATAHALPTPAAAIAAATEFPGDRSPEPSRAAASSLGSYSTGWRTRVWAVMALAAAVLIMLAVPTPKLHDANLAHVSPTAAPSAAAPPQDAANGLPGESRIPADRASEPLKNSAVDERKSYRKDDGAGVAGLRFKADEASKGAPVENAKSPMKPGSNQALAKKVLAQDRASDPAASRFAGGAGGAADAGQPKDKSGKSNFADGQVERSGRSDEFGLAEQRKRESSTVPAPGNAAASLRDDGKKQENADLDNKAGNDKPFRQQVAQSAYTVNVDVALAAVRSGSLEKLFSRRQIELDDAARPELPASPAANRFPVLEAVKQDRHALKDTPTELDQTAQLDELQLVGVECTSTELALLLADLRTAPQAFVVKGGPQEGITPAAKTRSSDPRQENLAKPLADSKADDSPAGPARSAAKPGAAPRGAATDKPAAASQLTEPSATAITADKLSVAPELRRAQRWRLSAKDADSPNRIADIERLAVQSRGQRGSDSQGEAGRNESETSVNALDSKLIAPAAVRGSAPGAGRKPAAASAPRGSEVELKPEAEKAKNDTAPSAGVGPIPSPAVASSEKEVAGQLDKSGSVDSAGLNRPSPAGQATLRVLFVFRVVPDSLPLNASSKQPAGGEPAGASKSGPHP